MVKISVNFPSMRQFWAVKIVSVREFFFFSSGDVLVIQLSANDAQLGVKWFGKKCSKSSIVHVKTVWFWKIFNSLKICISKGK